MGGGVITGSPNLGFMAFLDDPFKNTCIPLVVNSEFVITNFKLKPLIEGL